jgi:stage V sporulation protein SpoVS
MTRLSRQWMADNLKRKDVAGAVVSSLDVNRDRTEISRYACSAATDADDIIARATTDAEAFAGALSGVQTFIIVLIDENDRTMATMSFTVDGGLVGDENSIASEPATATGQLAQLMRHLETRERGMTALVAGIVGHQARTIDRLGSQVEKMATEKFSTLELVESLLSGKHVREMEMKRLEQQGDTKKNVIEKIGPYLAAMLNKVNGAPIVPQRASEFEMSSQEFIKLVTPSQMDQSGIFTPQQIVVFVTMLEQAAKIMMTTEQQEQQAQAVHNATVGEPNK